MSMPRSNWILFGFYVLLSISVLVGALVSPVIRQYSYAPLRDLLLPPPKPVVITMLYSTEKEAWIEEMIQVFHDSNLRVNGKPVQIETQAMGSREMVLSIIEGKNQPILVSPASSLQASILEDLSASKFGSPLVKSNDPKNCRSVVTTPLVLVAWRERANVLWGKDPGDQLWKDLHAAVTSSNGWGTFGHPEWGYVKFGHTNPQTSNSGLMTIVLLSYDYFENKHVLESADIVSNEGYKKWFLEMEQSISSFGESTGTYMKDIVAYGPSVYDVVAVYEATAIEQADNAVGRYGELYVYYPPATVLSDHPVCVMQADWVSDEQAQAAVLFTDFLLKKPAQQAALMKYGFRPVDSSISLDQSGSPLNKYATNGLKIQLPPQIELPGGDVLNNLLDFWVRNVQK